MAYFFLYHPNTGIGQGVMSGEEVDVVLQGYPYIACPQGTLDTSHYVDVKVDAPCLKEKRQYAVVPRIKGITVLLKPLPKGTRVSVNTASLTVSDGELEIDFDIPGTYSISLTGLAEYIDETLEVTVG